MSIRNRDLVKSLRHVENRLCADCSAPFGDAETVFASITFGVWICKQCADVHESLGGISQIKTSVASTWTDSEVSGILEKSNTEINAIYERFIPVGWKKCAPNAKRAERELWIRAKYDYHLFTIPARSAIVAINKKSRQKSMAPSSTLPLRLVDFFVVASLGRASNCGDDFSQVAVQDIDFNVEISSCFPEPSSILDTVIPEHLGMFVFPQGAHVYLEDQKPHFFTFVLTDVTGVKLYGAALHIYELAEPDELAVLLGHSLGSTKLPATNLLYIPKALIFLSHYPFYNLFRCCLETLYRISLSSCPLPLERYIASCAQEVPLPPQGQKEVAFTLADCTMTITRPPKNQLPLVDFSYRPLFTCLSVDNILVIMGYLCAEFKICVCSTNIALLTPVQEALLSLLFPLVWQGAYVPITPATMLEILDAPVPIIMGTHSSYLTETDPMDRPRGVVFVDLDNDRVYHGTTESGAPREPIRLPEREGTKLRGRLIEFADCTHRANMVAVKTAGLAFPHNEHLIPIQVFSSESGFSVQRQHSSESITKGTKDTPLSKYPVRATTSSIPTISILDPSNNYGTKDAFDAREIRAAFLRFFVSIFKEYSSCIKSKATEGNNKSKVKQDPSSLYFDRQAFLAGRNTPYMRALMETQMLDKFIEERLTCPNQPEIKFFDESIADKLNRSKTQMMKVSTPFLNDKSGDIKETFSPPPPSNWGIPMNKHFVYPRFPKFNYDQLAPPRQARILTRAPEQRRLANSAAQVTALERTVERLQDQSTTKSLEIMLQEARSWFVKFTSLLTKVQAHIRAKRIRRAYRRQRISIIRIQRCMRRLRLRLLEARYGVHQQAMLRICQSVVRGYLQRQRYRVLVGRLIMIQSFSRMAIARVHLWKQLRAVKRLQSWTRSRMAVKKYRHIRRCIVAFQSLYRGKACRDSLLQQRVHYISILRGVIFELWKIEHTSLIERSKFWLFLQNKTSTLDLFIHVDELRRLVESLNIFRDIPTGILIMDMARDISNRLRLTGPKFKESLRVNQSNRDLVTRQRNEIYVSLKKSTDETTKNNYYKNIGLTSNKKRKRELSTLLWNDIAKADTSASISLELLGGDTSEAGVEAWLHERHSVRVRSALFHTVKACLLSIQRQKYRADRQITHLESSLKSVGRYKDGRSSSKATSQSYMTPRR